MCSKKKKSDKNAEKKQKKDLTGPTLLEISEYATNRDLAGSSDDNHEFADKSSKIRSLVSHVFIVRFNN